MVPAQMNKSIISGFLVLQDVISVGRPIGSSELSRRLDMEHSRANRILGTLAAAGMLQKNSRNKYIPGPGLHVLSALSLHASGLVPASRPFLHLLHAEGATVALGTLWRDTVVYLLHANPTQILAESAGAHANYPKEKSIMTMVLDAGSEPCFWREVPETREVSFAARIGMRGLMAIAAVYPQGHPRTLSPEETMEHIRWGAEAIARQVELI